jgi:hypothetical protein
MSDTPTPISAPNSCPFCGADRVLVVVDHVGNESGVYNCGNDEYLNTRPHECYAAEVARLTKERDESIAEIARLKAGGCARDQRTTQFCAEAVALQERVRRLEVAGDAMAAYDFIPDNLAERWAAAKEAEL